MRRIDKCLRIVLATSLGATFFYAQGCVSTVAKNVNPCGTIIECDPMEYDQLFVDYTRSDWNLDPTCSVPGYCGGTPFPPNSTTTTTTTGTTTGG